MPAKDNNFAGFLVLDFRKRRRHMQPKNTHPHAPVLTSFKIKRLRKCKLVIGQDFL